jgi:NAD+ kinase
MKIAVFGKRIDPEDVSDIIHLSEQLENHEAKVYVHELFDRELTRNQINFKKEGIFRSCKDLDNDFLCLISVGGDGTFLDTILLIRDLFVPVLGINTGRLGFLSNTATSEIDYAIQCLAKQNFSLEKRTLVQMNSKSKLFGADNFALNEISILKRDTVSMITIHVELDGVHLNSYWTDGLIISTATGSTAYSLSCGGPILMPGSGNFVLTPIAPHNLNVRPIVIDDESVLKLTVESRADKNLVALDSRSKELQNHEELEIKKADHTICLVQFENNSFIQSLRNKLNWGLDKRNS